MADNPNPQLEASEETPQRTPWWLTLLRLTLAALVIIAAAGPLWNPPVATSASKASVSTSHPFLAWLPGWPPSV